MPDTHANTRIKKLSPLLINQLAAGEVVTRPAAVVKELLENAIDAGASSIEVNITQGGMGMIEVVDNGTGIYPDDMVMAITRHATSKVADVANLQGITTLGFRGEALAAMSAVSRLTLISSHDESGIGRQLQVAGVLDDIPKMSPVVHHRGTTVTVRDLYFNVPARRGNLKSISTEFGHIETVVREVALARADVALTLFHDNKKRLSLSANTREPHSNNPNRLPLSRLEQAIGLALTDRSIEISVDLTSLRQQPIECDDSTQHNAIAINGWLWPMLQEQDQNKAAIPKLIYINGRLVKEALISNQMRQLAQGAQLAGMGYALYFDLPVQWLNVNVHPSKQRIKISPLNNILAHLSHVVRAQLKTIEPVASSTTVGQQGAGLANSSVTPSTASKMSLSSNLDRKSSDTQNSNNLSTDNLSNGRQVQAPKQSYQSIESQSLPASAIANHQTEILDDTSTFIDTPLATSSPLPICLDIVTDVKADLKNVSVNADIKTKKEIGLERKSNNNSVGYLLFYHEGQCLMITAADWQTKIKQLFASISHGFESGTWPNSAAMVNKQLATINTQMSTQDSMAFANDLIELLTNHAVKSIDSAHLVSLMLSSTP